MKRIGVGKASAHSQEKILAILLSLAIALPFFFGSAIPMVADANEHVCSEETGCVPVYPTKTKIVEEGHEHGKGYWESGSDAHKHAALYYTDYKLIRENQTPQSSEFVLTCTLEEDPDVTIEVPDTDADPINWTCSLTDEQEPDPEDETEPSSDNESEVYTLMDEELPLAMMASDDIVADVQVRTLIELQTAITNAPTNGDLRVIEIMHDIIMDNQITISGNRNIELIKNITNPGVDNVSLIIPATGTFRHFALNTSSLTINDGIILTSSGEGATRGGIAVNSGGTFNMNGGKITNCAGSGTTPMIQIANGTFNMDGGAITYNETYNASMVQCTDGTFNLRGGTISNNRSRTDNAIVSATRGTINITGGEITGNNNTGVHQNGGIFTMSGGTISGNTATNGGGVRLSGTNNLTATMSGGTISGNTATNGGGISLSGLTAIGDLTFNMTGGTISDNTATENGGGIFVTTASTRTVRFNLNGGIISDNTATNGGGVATDNSTAVTFAITGGTIEGNTATANGGGVYANASTALNVSNGRFINNKAEGDGGGIFRRVTPTTGLTISANTVFAENSARVSYFGPLPATWTTTYNNVNWYGENSLGGIRAEQTEPHVLNNFDVNYTPVLIKVTFLNWNGSLIEEQFVEQHRDAKAPDDPTREGRWAFIGWDTEFTNVTAELTVKALFIATHEVTFLDNDGNTIAIVTVEHGSPATPPDDPTLEGHTFKGWDNDLDNITEDITVKPIFDINEYTVTFVDSEGNIIATVTVEHGSPATPPDDPTLEGYTFKGWDNDLDNITEDITVKPIFDINEYTVTFVDSEGNIIKEEVVEHGSPATPPDDPTLEGHTFKGWDTDLDNITEDITVKPIFEINEYTVTFVDYNGAPIGDPQVVKHGNPATPPDDPTREGHTFVGWDKPLSNVTSNLVVTAQHRINTHTVQFVDHDDTVIGGVQTINFGSPATAPANPTRTGYTFIGWDRPVDNITEDTVVKAQYRINTYTVQFVDHNGAPIGNMQTVNHGSPATAPASPTRSGYTFIGWDRTFDNVTGNLTVTALYSQIPAAPVTQTVTTNTGGGTAAPQTTTTTTNTDAEADEQEPDETPPQPEESVQADQPNEPDIIADEPDITLEDPAIAQAVDPTETIISDAPNDIPLSPAPGFRSHWSLVNLILSIISVIAVIITALIVAFAKRRDDKEFAESEEESRQRYKLRWFALTALIAIAGVVLFILTQDMTLPMRLVDLWTLVHAVFLAVQLVFTTLIFKREHRHA